jgi:cell division protein ZapA (FtsZ GTPase activity inhibitor)
MKTFEVKILGQRYKVRSDEGEEYIQRLAAYVHDQLLEVQKGSRTVATHNVAILAALGIADSLFKLRDEDARLKKEVKERIRKLLKQIRSGKESEGRE